MLGNWLNPLWSEAFAWAWLHSWWQGALAAALYVGAARALGSARARYAVGCAALLLALALPAATFYALSDANAARQMPARAGQMPAEEPWQAQFAQLAGYDATTTRAADATARERKADSWRQQAAAQFAALSPVLTLLWLTGVLALSARTLGGWRAVRRLRQTATPAPRHWQERLRKLAARVCVSRAARLGESAVVKVPTAIGWLRPVILVPAGAFAGLPPRQLEALLIHELAHLRRHDFLVNLLQIAVETLLFYHPAAWWLSRQIRIEREHVCDDIAVAALGEPFVYAHALTNLELYRRDADWTSVALASNGGNLMQRIQRLIKPQTAPRRPLVSGALLLVLLGSTLLGGGFVFNKMAARAKDHTAPGKRKIAVGFVAVPFAARPKLKDSEPAAVMRTLIENLKREQIPAIGFAHGARLDDAWSRQLLLDWLDAGFELGTGNYSHSWFYGQAYDDYVADLAKNEEGLRPVLAERGKTLRYFSYPMLNTGPDAATKARFEGLLRERGYSVAKFTIDNDDWVFGRAYQEALARQDAAAAQQITAEYLPYMSRLCDFYEGLSREQFGREIPQILLITTNSLTTEQLPALARMLRERGYEFVTMEEALKDEAYSSPDTYTGKTGISWLQRWSITRGGQWQPEPKPTGYLEQIQMHKGQGNLKAPPAPPASPALPAPPAPPAPPAKPSKPAPPPKAPPSPPAMSVPPAPPAPPSKPAPAVAPKAAVTANSSR